MSHQEKACRFAEERIALLFEDDLPQDERAVIEAHVAQCAECRQFEAELRDSQAIFKSIREEVTPAAAVVEMRQRVLNGIESNWFLKIERLFFAGWRWRYATAALVLALGIGVFYRQSPPETGGVSAPQAQTGRSVATNPPPTTSPAAPDKTPAQPPLLSQEGTRPKRIAQPTAPAEEPRQIVVKLLTDDPDIVIYWLVDEKNGGE